MKILQLRITNISGYIVCTLDKVSFRFHKDVQVISIICMYFYKLHKNLLFYEKHKSLLH